MSDTVVVNCRTQAYDVYIGRPSKWGNPFTIGRDGNRAEVIEKYRKYILNNPALISSLGELKGKRIACFCSPNPCHGDILVELIKKLDI